MNVARTKRDVIRRCKQEMAEGRTRGALVVEHIESWGWEQSCQSAERFSRWLEKAGPQTRAEISSAYPWAMDSELYTTTCILIYGGHMVRDEAGDGDLYWITVPFRLGPTVTPTRDPRLTTESLYRMRDTLGRLLYIGITRRGDARFDEHSATKPWWTQVAAIEVQHYATRAEVEAAEKAAIRDEQPLYNKAHNAAEVPL